MLHCENMISRRTKSQWLPDEEPVLSSSSTKLANYESASDELCSKQTVKKKSGNQLDEVVVKKKCTCTRKYTDEEGRRADHVPATLWIPHFAAPSRRAFFSLFALFVPPPCAVYVCTLRRRGLMHQRVYVSGGTIQISLLFNLNIAGEKKKYERTTMSANRQIQCLSTPELFSFFRSKYNYPKVRDSRFTSRRRVNRCWHGIRKNSR